MGIAVIIDMKEIPLTQGKVAIVDDIDYDFLMQWKWCYDSGYAKRHDYSGAHPKTVYMYKATLNRIGVILMKQLRVRGSLDYRRDILSPPLDTSPGLKKIPLSCGKFTIVDGEDYKYLMKWNWHVNHGGVGYAIRSVWQNRSTIYMHRVILKRMGFKDFAEVDHINGVKLDNRRENLRPATQLQQSYNCAKPSNNISGYKGVHFNKNYGKWQAGVRKNGKTIYLGLFDDLKDAARAYNEAAKKHFGEFARLNKV